MTTEIQTAGVAEWLADRTVDAVNREITSLVQSTGCSLKANRVITFATQGEHGEMIPAKPAPIRGYSVVGELPDGFSERVQNFLTPAPHRQIGKWLAELSFITAKRADDEGSADMRMAAYTDRLAEYPADVVRQALLRKTWKFFPTWHELKEVCDTLSRERRLMVAALRNVDVSDVSDQPRQETPEEKEERSERIRRMVKAGDDAIKEMRRKLADADAADLQRSQQVKERAEW